MSFAFSQLRSKLFIFFFPFVADPEGIADFLDGLAVDVILQIILRKPAIHSLRLENRQLRNQPCLRHLNGVMSVIVGQRQKLGRTPLAQP